MKKRLFMLGLTAALLFSQNLKAHCQMPCGIYHDDMVFDQIDQYVETMYKGITVISDSKFTTIGDRNETIRWVGLKEKESDETARLLTTYFLQQKIKPGEPDTAKRLESAHRLLFLLVAIKQNVDLDMLQDFSDEWDKFKTMFHVEGYECKMENIKLKKRAELEKQVKEREQKKGGNYQFPAENK